MLTDGQAATVEALVEVVYRARRQAPARSANTPADSSVRAAIAGLRLELAGLIGWRAADLAVTDWIITRRDLIELAYYYAPPADARVRLPDGREGRLDPLEHAGDLSDRPHPEDLHRWVRVDAGDRELHGAPTLVLLDELEVDPPPPEHARALDRAAPAPDVAADPTK